MSRYELDRARKSQCLPDHRPETCSIGQFGIPNAATMKLSIKIQPLAYLKCIGAIRSSAYNETWIVFANMCNSQQARNSQKLISRPISILETR